MNSPWDSELEVAIAAAREAGATVRDLYDRAAAAEYIKGDGSPVTDADLAADQIIRRNLTAAFPGDAILTEEGADDLERLNNARCWVVDPIDGTQQFIERTGEFDILIALVVDGEPVVGVVYQPTSDTLLYAAQGQGAWIEQAGDRTSLHFKAVAADQTPRIMTSFWFGAPDNLPVLQKTADRLGSETPSHLPPRCHGSPLHPTRSRSGCADRPLCQRSRHDGLGMGLSRVRCRRPRSWRSR